MLTARWRKTRRNLHTHTHTYTQTRTRTPLVYEDGGGRPRFTVDEQTVAVRVDVAGLRADGLVLVLAEDADGVADERVVRRTGNGTIVERDVDDVVAGLQGHVGDGTRAVAVVAAVDGRLARALHGDAQPALARLLRVDRELGRPVDQTAGQAGPAGRHLARVAGLRARHPVRAAQAGPADRLAAQRHADPVLARLVRREVHHVSVGRGRHVRRHRAAGRTRDRHGEFRPARVPRDHPELLQTVDRRHCGATRACTRDDIDIFLFLNYFCGVRTLRPRRRILFYVRVRYVHPVASSAAITNRVCCAGPMRPLEMVPNGGQLFRK